MDKFIQEALKIQEIEEKIVKFEELDSWCDEKEDFNKPVKETIQGILKDLNEEFNTLAMKGSSWA